MSIYLGSNRVELSGLDFIEYGFINIDGGFPNSKTGSVSPYDGGTP